jgi:hypothetical protein
MSTEPSSPQPNLAKSRFRWLNVTVQSLAFALKALPKVKWAVAIGIAVTCVLVLVEWLVIAQALNFFDENATSTLFDLATSIFQGGIDIILIIPMIWIVAYTLLFDDGIRIAKGDNNRRLRTIVVVLEVYIITGFIIGFGSSVARYVRVGLTPDAFGEYLWGRLFWSFLAEALPFCCYLLASYFWALFLLAIPFALEGEDKPMRQSARATKSYVWHGFGPLLLSGGFFVLLNHLIEWVFDFVPADFDKPVDVALAVLYMLVYASSILATVYIARYVQGLSVGREIDAFGTFT